MVNVVNEFGNASALLTDKSGNLRVSAVSDTIELFYNNNSSADISLAGGTADNPRHWEVFPSGESGSLKSSVVDALDFRNTGSFIVTITCSRSGNDKPNLKVALLGFNDDVLTAGIGSTLYFKRATVVWDVASGLKQFCRAAGSHSYAPSGFKTGAGGFNQWAETSEPIAIRHKYYKLHMVNQGLSSFNVQVSFSASS